jgi:glycoprotein endo-alpha-1,2-mannosidase
VRKDLQYIMSRYGKHPALFRWKEKGNRPLFFFYDAYLTPAHEWASLFTNNGKNTIRGTELDSIMISLYVDSKDQRLLTEGGFDGAYTYFASNGFTYGSSTSSWPTLSKWCEQHGKIFIPSVGPGYDDTRIR